MRTPFLLLGVLALAGCTGKTVDAGSNDAASRVGSPIVFKGYFEAFQFPSGSDTVVLTLSFAGDGTVTGTVFYGDGPPLPPPTDPNVGYPPYFNDECLPPGPFAELTPTLEGFAYTLFGGKYSAPRVTLGGIDPREVVKAWCELQTPGYDPSSGKWDCLPNTGAAGLGAPNTSRFCDGGDNCAYIPPDGGWTPVNCLKMDMCISSQGACTCDTTSCTYPLVAPTRAPEFDMQLNGTHLDGTGAFGVVHLIQQ